MKQLFLHVFLSFVFLCHLKQYECCWGPINSANSAVMPEEASLNVGSNFNVSCYLNTTKYQDKPVNCSNIILKFNNTVLPTKCVDSRTSVYEIKNGTVDQSGIYYCYFGGPPLAFNNTPLMCTREFSFGYPPLEPNDFNCISENLENLTCKWKPQDNKVKSTFSLEQRLYYSQVFDGIPIDCPEQFENGCRWRSDTFPPYATSYEILDFALILNNSLGVKTFRYKFNQSAIVRPRPAAKFNVFQVGVSHIKLNWLPSDRIEMLQVGLLLIYQLQYKSEFDNNTVIFEPLFKNVTGGNLTGLYANTVYDIYLRYRTANSVGEDMWSSFVKIQSKTLPKLPNAPKASPYSYEVLINSDVSRSITLFWQKMDKRYFNAENFVYEITCFPTSSSRNEQNFGNGTTVHKKIIGSLNHFTFGSLDLHTAYQFIIKSKNDVGLSDDFTSITVDKTDNTLLQPYDLSAVKNNNSEYQLSWKYFHETPVTNFTIFWCEDELPRRFICKGLLNYTTVPKENNTWKLSLSSINYQLAISANSETASSGMTWFECIIPIDSPIKRIEIENVEGKSSTSLKIAWKSECVAQNMIKFYEIRYCKPKICGQVYNCQDIRNVSFENVQGTVEHWLTDLEPFTYYGVLIRGINSHGVKNRESTMRCGTTLEAAPNDAPIIKNVTADKNSIFLEWSKPLKPNGDITSYNIYYKNEIPITTKNPLLSYTLKNLLFYTKYNISIQACVKDACSPSSSSTVVRTGISVPSVMGPPQANVRNATDVQVSWKAPDFPNGPIDYYVLYLYQMEDKNKTHLSNFTIPGNETSHIVTLNCLEERGGGSWHSFQIQAVNLDHNTDQLLEGSLSDATETRLCYDLIEGAEFAMIIGLTVGGALVLVILVFVLYIVVRWMKKRVDTMKNFKVQLPSGLETPYSNPMNSYDNFKNGSIQRGSSPKPAYGRLDSYVSEEGFKNRHGSGTSQYSAASTDELLVKQAKLNEKNEKNGRNPSGDSSGVSSGGHDSLSSSLTHRTNLSSDSGNEADLNNPPSPDIVREEPQLGVSLETDKSSLTSNESRMSSSKDSGLDKGDDFDLKTGKGHIHPYTKITGIGGSGYTSIAAPPYSKIGMAQSCYVPFSRGSRNLAMFGLNMANSEPNIPELQNEENLALQGELGDPSLLLSPSHLQQEETGVMPYSKFGLSRSIQNVQDMLGNNFCINNPSIHNNRPANLNLVETDHLAVLPYSRFGLRRQQSPTNKNNPYVTVGMAYMVNPGPDPNTLLQNKKDPLSAMFKKPAGMQIENQKALQKTQQMQSKNGYVPIEKLQAGVKKIPIAEAKENQLPNAYSKLGIEEQLPATVPSPAQSPMSKPSSSGYVSLDDVKIMNKIIPDEERQSSSPNHFNNRIQDAPPESVVTKGDSNFDKNGYLVLSILDSPVKKSNPDTSPNVVQIERNPDPNTTGVQARQEQTTSVPVKSNSYISHDEMLAKMNPQTSPKCLARTVESLNEPSSNNNHPKSNSETPIELKRSVGYVTVDRLPMVVNHTGKGLTDPPHTDV